jgi:hypothetical protein
VCYIRIHEQVVSPIGPVERPDGCAAAEMDEDAVGSEQTETADATAVSLDADDEATAARLERLDGLQRQDDDCAANSDDELDALVQQELDSDDDLDALVAAELDAETEAEPEPELEPTDGEWPRTAEEMDEHLEICFLQAARTRLHKKKVLPLDAAVVYAGHMRKVRRTGTDLVRPLSW